MKITKHGIAVIEGDECISKWVEESGRLDHDQNMLPLVLKHIRAGDRVVDAGAYIGDHTIAYAKAVGLKGRVYAFEPDPESFKCLDHNLREEKTKNVKLFQAGLGACAAVMGIKKVPTNAGMNYLVDEGDGEALVYALDNFDLDRVDFMKIDCEGYELGVLAGARETIKLCRPKMLIELNDLTLDRSGVTRSELLKFISELGYTYRNIYPGKGIDEYQMDLLCLPIK